jgi:hypothetical protein
MRDRWEMEQWTFEVRDEGAATDPHPEDGEGRMTGCYSIIAENPRGERKVYFHKFCGPTKWEGGDDNLHLVPRNGEYKSDRVARARANLFIARVNLAVAEGKMRGFDERYWHRATSCYGSEAWSAQDEFDSMDDEEREFHGH